MEYSDVQDGYSGTGNITNNPLFAANYSLASNSPCIDAGTNNTVLRDWQNEARWDDPAHTNTVSIWDIGFDEYPDNDNDGLPDAVETGTGIYLGPTDTGTDPDDADTDGDGINDGAEVDARTDPNNPDVVCPTVLITYPASGSVMMVYP